MCGHHHQRALQVPPTSLTPDHRAHHSEGVNTSIPDGMQDARQGAVLHKQREAIQRKSLGKSHMLLHFMYKFIGWCSPLKSNGNFSFPFFDGDFLKPAVTDKQKYSLAHTGVLFQYDCHTVTFQLLQIIIKCKPTDDIVSSFHPQEKIMAGFYLTTLASWCLYFLPFKSRNCAGGHYALCRSSGTVEKFC